MMRAVQEESNNGNVGLCGACFTGKYPVAVDESVPPRHLRLIRV